MIALGRGDDLEVIFYCLSSRDAQMAGIVV